MARRIRMPGAMKIACEMRPKARAAGPATARKTAKDAATAIPIPTRGLRRMCRDAVDAGAPLFHRGAHQEARVGHHLLDRRDVHLARAEARRALLVTNVLAMLL